MVREAGLTAEVWKAMTETKSSDEVVFLPKGTLQVELRRPEKSENPFPVACKMRKK